MSASRNARGGGHDDGGGGHDSAGGLRWLLTYADMITLLLALFIFLYSISTVNAAKLESFTSAFRDLFGIERGPMPGDEGVIPLPGRTPRSEQPRETRRTRTDAELAEEARRQQEALNRKVLTDLQQQLEQEFPDLLAERKMAILEQSEGLVLRFQDTTLFELGRADITAQAIPLLERVASHLQTLTNSIRVEGHTDALPIRGAGQFRSNWDLSGARAASVVEFFISRGGIVPQRLSIAGYGEYRPIAPNRPNEGNPLNRRVEVMVIAPYPLASSQNPAQVSPAANPAPTPALQ